MPVSFRAHFDGRVLIPDEPVTLPVDRPLSLSADVEPAFASLPAATVEERQKALQRFLSSPGPDVSLSDDALRRENIYERQAGE